jgi:hypothetical protein
VLEWEFEDLAEFDSAWAAWSQLPTTPAFSAKFDPLLEQGTATSEIWDVHTL